AIGSRLIQQNCQRFQVDNVHSVSGSAPASLPDLPTPDRVFIGGSGGQLCPILDLCHERLTIGGRMLLALATLEHLTTTLLWLEQHSADYTHDLVQLQVLRSVPIANLTRLTPLNPVTLVGMTKTA
ncbi:cobalamin biosynthesis bifunctional protein CbiET, partial [Leptolyngbya sp. FACHB-36]|nr:cobalamin biosynthesis bifunctional protein CbiET [Leptolyngbya sp. FACHB-36]